MPRTPSLTSSAEPLITKSPSAVLTPNSYNLLLQYSSLLEAFIKMAADEDKLVTKPFKFVTGKSSSLKSLSAVDTDDVHGSRSAPSALSFLRNAWTEASLTNVLCPGFDARFPNQNQCVSRQFLLLWKRAQNFYRTKHCWQNYVDYHKCILAKGEDFTPCRQVLH